MWVAMVQREKRLQSFNASISDTFLSQMQNAGFVLHRSTRIFVHNFFRTNYLHYGKEYNNGISAFFCFFYFV